MFASLRESARIVVARFYERAMLEHSWAAYLIGSERDGSKVLVKQMCAAGQIDIILVKKKKTADHKM